MDKIKVIQIGMCHEHAIGKMEVLKQRTDLFDLVGYVDERDFCNTPRLPNPNKPEYYSDVKKLTLEEIAEKTNFSSAFALSKAFKKRYGISPERYRKKLTQQKQ